MVFRGFFVGVAVRSAIKPEYLFYFRYGRSWRSACSSGARMCRPTDSGKTLEQKPQTEVPGEYFSPEDYKQQVVHSDPASFAFLLRQCGNSNELSLGKCVHAKIIQSGHEQNGFLANLLVQMYGKCGAVEDAGALLSLMSQRDVFSWTFMIGAYAQLGLSKDVLHVFHQMQLDGVMPNKFTFIYMLSSCTRKEALPEGKLFHTYVINSEFGKDAVVGTGIVCMYSKCGSLSSAWNVFDEVREKDGVSWNAIISASAEHGHAKEALHFFKQMQHEGLMPSKVTLLSVLDACTRQLALVKGKRIHTVVIGSGYHSDTVLGNALVSMYGKCGSLADASRIFEEMTKRNVISWTAMIDAFAEYGQSKEVVRILHQMQQEHTVPDKVTFTSSLSACATQAALLDGKWIHSCIVENGSESDVVVGTALVNMYGKCGSLSNARWVFDKLPKRDVVCWNAMIAGYSQHGYGKEALELFGQIEVEHLMPNKITFISLLDACANQAALSAGKRMHTCILRCGFESDIVVSNALVNMYGKCGSLEDSKMLFDSMPERNVISWTAIISAYGQQGEGKKTLQLFEKMIMEGLMPSDITFVSIFSACSHTGLVDEGWHYFVSMKENKSLSPTLEHFDCVVDLFGRAGLVDQGEALINSMPFQPAVTTWMAFLGACSIHFDCEQAVNAALHLLELESDNAASYVLLSNIFITTGRPNDAENSRKKAMNEQLKNQLDFSFIEDNSTAHECLMHDKMDAREEGDAELKKLGWQLTEVGYLAETQVRFHNADEEESNQSFNPHFENVRVCHGSLIKQVSNIVL